MTGAATAPGGPAAPGESARAAAISPTWQPRLPSSRLIPMGESDADACSDGGCEVPARDGQR